ncbi:lipopolysaccharide biosynthesis protein [Candidatus Sulfurimonas marisnigri]|uniref:Lipopolysaccharide biosynthesis protein n=1 Tax=Candidatus Sulfurimonas marisnigri TaxID=2740405 RepID=A0A7S7LZ18_9BACT|nr:lipopolysaccharide biosynthesis protein [Candidatus Sulfurimonas marisnigri]QOY54076.1 lipopolysaccharide biosynthesis protein [Candidatus Sulfurimonas marisnigri]
MQDSLKKRYLIKLLSNIVNGIINIVLVAIVPKALGPIAFGQFSYLQQFFSQFIAFLDAGTSTAFFTKLSAKSSRKELITFYFIFTLVLLFTLFLIVYLLRYFDYIAFLLPEIPNEYVFYGALFGFFTWVTQVYIKISDAYALTVSVELIKIMHKIITLVLLLYMVNFLPFDLNIYFYFHFIALVSFLMIITILFIKKSIFSKQILDFKIKYFILVKEFFAFSSPLFMFNVIAIAISLFDIWLLQKVSGSIQTGFYGLAYSIAAMCFLFTSAMTPIISREFSKSYAQNDMEHVKELFQKYIPMLYAISAYFSIFIAFQAENLLHIFTDEKFKDALFVLMIMAFYPIHQTYGQLSGSLFFALEETKIYRNIGLISSLLGLILTYIFIYLLELGAVGFACKMVIIQIISVNIQLYFNVKFLKIKLSPFIFHQIISILFFIVLAYFSAQIVLFEESILGNFLFQGTLYTMFVFITVLFFPFIFSSNKKEIMTFVYSIKQKLKKSK